MEFWNNDTSSFHFHHYRISTIAFTIFYKEDEIFTSCFTIFYKEDKTIILSFEKNIFVCVIDLTSKIIFYNLVLTLQ